MPSMGTSSITVFNVSGDPDGDLNTPKTIAVLYRQSDGYPTGMGADILECFKGKKPVNGFSEDDEINGVGDMAVQLIAFVKEKLSVGYDYDTNSWVKKPVNTPGGLYLYPPSAKDSKLEFKYTLTFPLLKKRSDQQGAKVHLLVESSKVLYDGPLDDFDPDEAEEAAFAEYED